MREVAGVCWPEVNEAVTDLLAEYGLGSETRTGRGAEPPLMGP